MVWFRKERPEGPRAVGRGEVVGLHVVCPACGGRSERPRAAERGWRCAACGALLPMPARARLDALLDPGAEPLFGRLISSDPLRFAGRTPYRDRLRAARATCGLGDAILAMRGAIDGIEVVAAAFEPGFLDGTFGAVVGATIAGCADLAKAERRPFVLVAQSAGPRLEEGAVALAHAARAGAALAALAASKTPFLAVAADPLRGPAAALALQADVVAAEPGARIALAGAADLEPRATKALAGACAAEELIARGLVDLVAPRAELRATLAQLLRLLWSSPSARPAPCGA
ncbi:MAG: carboxyl transferase domain-containing protein [Candidatus Polarisedimenticolia bacterium]|nr:hypothetical protein [bacterium]